VTVDAETLVRRLVDEAMNGRDLDVLDELCSPRLAPKLRRAFEQFRAAFPDWHQDLVEVITNGDAVAVRYRCTGTHLGEWQGLAPTGRPMRVDEVHLYHLTGGRIAKMWALEDTWSRMRQLAGDDATLGELGSLG
jgi:predicted ester cyclase